MGCKAIIRGGVHQRWVVRPSWWSKALAVGSLRAELEAYKGLANPFEIVFD